MTKVNLENDNQFNFGDDTGPNPMGGELLHCKKKKISLLLNKMYTTLIFVRIFFINDSHQRLMGA